jgi:formylglycine-generating enzyme required for sulfatase activity
VEITRPFFLGVYQVTQEEYQRLTGMNPSHFAPKGKRKSKAKADAKRFPVESVSWDDAVAFCARLSELPEESAAGRTYRLPTEAEWEYSCRGGATFKDKSAPFYFAEPTFSLDSSLANFDGNYPYGGGKKGHYLEGPTPVGSFAPNPLGLCDMHGNVWEWCCDWYDADYYSQSEQQDPQGPPSRTGRVLRGGSWVYDGRGCRAACRSDVGPGYRDDGIGFRVVLRASPGLVSS